MKDSKTKPLKIKPDGGSRARLEHPPPHTHTHIREPASRTRSGSGSYVTRERGLYLKKHTFMKCDTKADPETKGMTLQDAKAAKNRVVN